MTTDTNSILSSSPLHLAAGQKLAGCYLLERPLEVGGGHLVWIAQDEVLGKEVSLHFLPTEVTRDAAAVEELRREVKRSRPLIHPGVLRVYDLVEGDDWTAVAMESFEGRCLAALLQEKGRFEVEDVETWLDQVCVTLEEAQRIKLTHRDLAPDNFFVTPAGRLLLANFGLSRVVQDSLRRSRAGSGGVARLHTLSPQLLDGATPAPTDDVYGLGTLFFELLTGQPLFSGGDVADKIRHASPPRLSEVRDGARDPGKSIPDSWDNVIAACLNKAGNERPHRPSEIVSSIEAYTPPPVAPAEAAILSEEALTEVEAAAAPRSPEISPEEPTLSIAEPVLVEEHLTAEVPVIIGETEAVEEPEFIEELVAVEESVPVEEPAMIAESVAAEEPVGAIAMHTEARETIASAVPDPIETAAPVVEPESLIPAPTPSAPEHLPKTDLMPPPKPVVKRPVQLYDTEEDAFSAILPRRFRFPAAVAAAVALLLLLINGFFSGPKEKSGQPPKIATSDASDRSELTSIKNSVGGAAESPAKKTPDAIEGPNEPFSAPEPAAIQKAPAKPEMLVAAGPTPSVPPAGSSSAAKSAPALSLEKEITEKSAAVERLKRELAATEKSQQASVKEQQASVAALAAAQKAIEDKLKTAATAKKVADDLLAARKKREDEQKEAETAARAAQQLAAEKTRAAEDAKKALAEFEAQNRDKLAAQEKADTELKSLQQTLAERQKSADAQARSAATVETARQQQIAALQQTEQELAQAKANISKASVEEERRRQGVNAEKQKLDDELASMRALFEQKMKDIEDRRRQIEGAPKTSTTPTTKPELPPTAEVKAPPVAAPAPTTLPLMAMKTDVATLPTATPQPATATPISVVTSASMNSLGMKFAPVGEVFFCVWQTRVKDFETFAKTVNLKSTAWRGPGFRQGPDHPVVNVTWTEAIAFCKWLTDKEHKDGSLPANQFYRLPYDLEWSKAVALPDESGKTPEARDMSVPDLYPWGTDWPPPKGSGNYTGEETGSDVAIKGYEDGFAWTSPVGSFPPNKFGLYDMGGNVWQWCMDSWNNESKAKVLRGASWYNGALKLSLLSSCRVHAAPDSSTDNYGFRIVRASESSAGKPTKK